MQGVLMRGSTYIRPATAPAMNRTFLANIIFLVFVNVLVKPFYLFAIDRQVQNVLPAGDYGVFATLFGFSFLFQIVNDFGIQGYNNRRIAQHSHLLSKYFPDFLTLKAALGVTYAIVVLLAGWLTGYLLRYPWLLGGILFNHFLTSLLLFLRSNVSGLAMYRTDSLLSVVDRLLLIILLGSCLWIPGWRTYVKLEWFIGAQTIALSMSCLLALSAIRPHLDRLQLRFRPRLLLVILRQSYPYALVVFLMTLYTRLDSVMVEQLHPAGVIEVDRYASAYRLLDASNMIGFLFATLLLPMFARQLRAGEHPGDLAGFSARLLLSGAICLTGAVLFVRTPLMAFLYTDGDHYSATILAWLMGSFIGVCGTYIYGTLLTANGRLMPMNRIFAASVLLNVLLNWWLIPRQGAVGAAIATFVTQMGVFLAQLWLAYQLLPLRTQWRSVFALGTLAVLVVVFGYSLNTYTTWPWPWRFLFTGLAGLLLALALRLFDFRGIRQLLSSNTRPKGNV